MAVKCLKGFLFWFVKSLVCVIVRVAVKHEDMGKDKP